MAYPNEEDFSGDWTETARYLYHLNDVFLKTVGRKDFSEFMDTKFKDVLIQIKNTVKNEESLRKKMSALYTFFASEIQQALYEGEKLSVVCDRIAGVIAEKRLNKSGKNFVDFKEMERANEMAEKMSKAHLKAKNDYRDLWALKDNPYILEMKLKKKNLASGEVVKSYKECINKAKDVLNKARKENFVYLAEAQILTQENIILANKREERKKASTKLIVKARKKPTIKEKYNVLKPRVLKARINEIFERD